jgi:hypothetical protein
MMNTWLCVNAASGSYTDEAIRAVAQALESAGAAPRRVIDVPNEGAPPPAELDRAGIGRIVVFAGDGTLNCVVAALEGWRGEVLVLPGGTANLLSHALHGEREAEEIARDIATLRPVRRSCIRTSQGTALIEVLAGPGATWSDVREGLREGDLPEIAASSLTAIRQSTTGPMVAIADPPLGRPEGYSGIRLEAAAGGMLVEGYGTDTVADYLLQGLALLRRDFRQGPHEEFGPAREIVCRSLGDGPIELMIDGERRTGGGEERFSLAELEVNLLASDL